MGSIEEPESSTRRGLDRAVAYLTLGLRLAFGEHSEGLRLRTPGLG
jgi:hypothetical protein